MNANQLINNWYIWNLRDNILPFTLLSHHNVAQLGSVNNLNAGKTKLRQMRLVIHLVKKYARIGQCYESDKDEWRHHNIQE